MHGMVAQAQRNAELRTTDMHDTNCTLAQAATRMCGTGTKMGGSISTARVWECNEAACMENS